MSAARQRGPSHPVRAVLLVGFMASGKSTVGRRVASSLGWDFVDVDARIETAAGASVQDIFRERGEASFRRLEEEATREALAAARAVIATGGGWAAVPGRMESLPDEILSVWLKVPAAVAVRRAQADATVRPLLEVDDPEARAAELIRTRTPFYRLAALHLDAEATSPDRCARTIVEAVCRRRTWS